MYEGISRQITDKMDPQISRLIYKQLLGTLTDREKAELDRWAAADEANASLARKLPTSAILAVSEHNAGPSVHAGPMPTCSGASTS